MPLLPLVPDTVHTLMIVTKSDKKARGRPKVHRNTEFASESLKQECVTRKKREYLHDSLNPSLAKKYLKRFVADEECKGNYPDGDLNEVDCPVLTEDFPVLVVTSLSVFRPIK